MEPFPDKLGEDFFSKFQHMDISEHQHQHPREYLTMNVGSNAGGEGHQAASAQAASASSSHINSIQRHQHRRSSIEATTNPSSKDLVPQPPPPPIHDGKFHNIYNLQCKYRSPFASLEHLTMP